MQTTNTSVIARRVRISDDYATLPYEAGWAIEAVFFVQAEGDHPDLAITVEVSPDGINWVRRAETTLAGVASARRPARRRSSATGSGSCITGATERAPARVLVHLNLKG